MAPAAAVEANPLLAFFFQRRIIHERRFRIGRGLLLFLRHQVRGDIFGILRAEPQAGHHRHVLDLQFVPVVGALAVVEIEE